MSKFSVLVALLVTGALALSPTSAGAASKSCGTVGSGVDRLHVRVVFGPISCIEARKVARAALHNAGTRIGKWRCAGGAGGIGCTKSSPRARIQATV
jgi:hypothetical protein